MTAKQKYAYHNKVGESISIAFLDGKTLTGTLLHIAQYELTVKKDDKEIAVFKHAIKYIL